MIPREIRKNVLLAATVKAGDISAPVRIRNMSQYGAMVDGGALPELGSTVVLCRLDLSVRSKVAWNKDGRCGLKLDSPVVIDEWISGIGSIFKKGTLGQLRVDQIQEAVRNRFDLPPEPEPPLQPPEEAGPIDLRIAGELAGVRQAVEAVADSLMNDMHVLTAHAEALQNLDQASAIIESLSMIMAAEDRERAITKVPMHDLRSRLSGIPTLK